MHREQENRTRWMRDRMVCRHLHGAAGKWTRKEEEPKYPPDRTCDVEHLRLDLSVDLPASTVEAICTQTLRAAYGPIDTITLDACDLDIRSVRDGSGRDLPHTYLNRKLSVRFPEPVAETAQLVIAYRVQDPSDGLFFFGPEEHEPDARPQLWSQGEDEGARHWIPCHDAPNERFTVELVVTAPEEFSVIGNGALLGVDSHGGQRTWHYREGVAIPSYLVSLVVGVFNKIEDRWHDTPVEYWIEPGREEEGRRSFGRTPDMIEFFSRQIDCPYPYEKYAQVAVRHFHFGGMENASATTQTDGTLHDERAAIDFTSDELVAHELAHMWFGDLITCKSWTHAWLNEGFATYFEALWKEWDKGREEFDYEMVLNADAYLAEPYRRAISTARYGLPFELFDMHLYPKAGWVLHMLRRRLGDDLFWKAVRLYLKRCAPGTAETIDLVRSFEEATGKSLGSYFDQWIFSPGHPVLEGEFSWDSEATWVKLSLKQTQKREDGTPVFRIPVRLEARMPNGSVQARNFEMGRAEETFFFPLTAEPKWVLFDPEGAVLRETKIKTPLPWVEAALLGKTRDERVLARVDRVRQLSEEAGTKAVEILSRVLREDPFWGVQAEAAAALGRVRAPRALDGLLAGINLENAKARRAVVSALGQFRDRRAGAALLDLVRGGDASYHVQMAALASLGRCSGAKATEELRWQLRDAVDRRDWHDVVAFGAVQGLAAARDESALDDILGLARDRSRYWSVRLAAVNAAAEIGANRPHLAPRLVDELVPFLEDPRILVHQRSTGALLALGHAGALGALQQKGETAKRPEMRKACLAAADELSARLKKGEEVDRLREAVEKLREETRAMKDQLAELKEKVSPQKGGSGGPGGKRPAARKAGRKAARRTARKVPGKVVTKAAARPATKVAKKVPKKVAREVSETVSKNVVKRAPMTAAGKTPQKTGNRTRRR
jgi:aminopeptidase N